MEYKTYVQKLPTLQAYYDEDAGTYHVKCQNGESDVPKDIFSLAGESKQMLKQKL